MNRRRQALEEWNEALKQGLLEEAKSHAMASASINEEIVQSSKELLTYMGIPFIQAPSEGEAQAAWLSQHDLVYASGSQDYDLFLFGSKVVVRNLAITGRRKLPRKNIYVNVSPERIYLEKLLSSLGITRQQLVWLGMLIGTDFNEGIEGIGPKTALKIVRQSKSLEQVQAYLKSKGLPLIENAEEVERVFLEPEVKELSQSELTKMISQARPSKQKIVEFMCDKHGFSADRVEKFADQLLSLVGKANQKSILDWS